MTPVIIETADVQQEVTSETPFLRVWTTEAEASSEAGEYLGCGCGLALGPNK